MFSEDENLAVEAYGGWHVSATVLVCMYNFVSQAGQNSAETGWDWYSRFADTLGIITFFVGAFLAWRAKNELQKLRELINRVNLVQDITDAKRVLMDIQNLHLNANERSLWRVIDRYSQVREQLSRIKNMKRLTREQEKSFVKMLNNLRVMQSAATEIVLSRDPTEASLDATTHTTLNVAYYNDQLTEFSETLEKILADTKEEVGK